MMAAYTASACARRRRIAVVLSHPVQYYAPWFRHIASQPDLDLTVLYLEPQDPQHDREFGGREAWDRDLLSGYRSIVLRNRAVTRDAGRFAGLVNPSLTQWITRDRFDACVIFGYTTASTAFAILLGRLRGVPVILRGDSHDLGRTPSRRSILVARMAFRLCSAFLSSGSANAAYFARRGAPADRTFWCPHAVDTRWFDPERPSVAEEAERHRASVDAAAGAPLVLFAGKWIPKKQPVELAQAFAAVAPPAARLVFVGSGELRPQLEAIAAKDSRIRLHGFVNQSGLPSWYRAADIFVLPSRGAYETWGLAINEAMTLGVPCLVSRVVGCQPDLVLPRQTGWVCNEDRISLEQTLAAALRELMPDREGWSRRVRAHIARWNYAAATEGLRRAVNSVIAR